MDSLKCQTSTATPAEPGDLPWRLGESFRMAMREFENNLNRGVPQNQKIWGDQYETRFEHILRMRTTDVTAQVLKAYSQAVKPRLKDYIPKREELIATATTIFVEAMRVLSC